MRKIQLLIVLALASALVPTFAAEGGRKNLTCEVVILGGGAGGLHTAYRLGPKLGAKVCLFEKEAELGGRIKDVSLTPGGPVFGTGAMRIMETQDVVFGLADELGIQYEAAPFTDDLINARGNKTYDSETMRALAYPLVSQGEGDLYDKLRLGPERANIGNYPELRSYMRSVIGKEEYHFLADVFRFRGDFTYPLDARGYMDFLDEDWDVCCTPSYPVGGMSEFIRRMEQKTLASGVRIFKAQPVSDLSRGNNAGGRYTVTTPDYIAAANSVVVAVDAEGFKHIGGNIATQIQSQQQFQDLIGIKAATVAQWWPSKWWKDAIPGKDIHRAWTTEHCINALEIPIQAYAANQMVTRTVYDDDKACVDFWEITAKRGIPAVEAEIKRGLEHLFPGVTIPQPLKTYVQIWPAGWYWLKAGSQFTNADIATWALAPIPGENVAMVGESYNPQRSTWSDGAYKSSINTLNSHYGFQLAGQTVNPNGPLPNFKGKPENKGKGKGRRHP